MLRFTDDMVMAKTSCVRGIESENAQREKKISQCRILSHDLAPVRGRRRRRPARKRSSGCQTTVLARSNIRPRPYINFRDEKSRPAGIRWNLSQ